MVWQLSQKNRQTIGGQFINRKISLKKKTDPARIRTQDRCNSTRDSLLYANPLKNLRSLIFFNSSYRMIQVICETSSQPERSLYSTEAQSRKSTYNDSFDCTLDLNGKQMSISEKKNKAKTYSQQTVEVVSMNSRKQKELISCLFSVLEFKEKTYFKPKMFEFQLKFIIHTYF